MLILKGTCQKCGVVYCGLGLLYGQDTCLKCGEKLIIEEDFIDEQYTRWGYDNNKKVDNESENKF